MFSILYNSLLKNDSDKMVHRQKKRIGIVGEIQNGGIDKKGERGDLD